MPPGPSRHRLVAALLGAALWGGCADEGGQTPPVAVAEGIEVAAAIVSPVASPRPTRDSERCAALLAAGVQPDLAPPVQPVAPADTVGRGLRPFRGQRVTDGVARGNLFGYRYERAGTPPGPVSIEPFFRLAMPYREGRALVMDEATFCYGYLSPDGTYAIAPRFVESGDFSEGLAPAAETDSLWGYIDRQGAWAIPPRFDAVNGFDGARAWASVGGRWGRIDREGRFVFPARFERVIRVGERLAHVMEGTRVGLYDMESERLIAEPRFAWVMPPEDGLMRAATGTTRDMGLWGYLNEAGEWAIRPQFEGVGPFVGDTAFVLLPDTADTAGDWGDRGFGDHLARIDRAGRVLDRPVRDARSAVPSRLVQLALPDSLFAESSIQESLLQRWVRLLLGPATEDGAITVSSPTAEEGYESAYAALYPRGVAFFASYGYESSDGALILPGVDFEEAVFQVETLARRLFREVEPEREGGGVRFGDEEVGYSSLGVWPTETGVVVRWSSGL